MSVPIHVHADGPLLRLTLARREALSVDVQVLAALDEALARAAGDASVRVIEFRGEGGSLAAGVDLLHAARGSTLEARRFARLGQDLARRIETLGKPVVAVLDDDVLGAGLELALACPLRIASERCRLGLPDIALGVLPGFGGIQRLARLLGRAAALELCLVADHVDATRAHALGLLQQVVPVGQLDAAAAALGARLARIPDHAVRAVLAVALGDAEPDEVGLHRERDLFAVALRTPAVRSRTAALLDPDAPLLQEQWQ
ncbi:enoyl-CoA hydratase/isomerase family protein [Coralloluteibacterium stylophorae]|uniref:Enoyl-CoA hydratase/isomerase family protein n=1 Tax=Coralloluteibacterium stylophorae TaxID=1776034 RepID=A0A8J8AYJ2_9GAMM|nr:enoyl-CoA hydratase/isomerase family protein [Coralloluteibacterium stylophorae]MBS7458914.1 enoyl-CoA hydratase/isomerase family protein [Coralloluteibacterium stylophorae]